MDNLTIFCAKYLIFVLFLAVFIYWVRLSRPKMVRLAVSMVIAGVIAIIFAKIAGKFYSHPRPFVAEHITPLIKHSADNGFPSEHSLASAAIATVAYLFNRKLGLWLVLGAVLVGLGRIGAHVHYGVDVIAGLLLGVLAGWLGYQIAKTLLQKKQPAVKPAAHKS